jgi:hypothetical protein
MRNNVRELRPNEFFRRFAGRLLDLLKMFPQGNTFLVRLVKRERVFSEIEKPTLN